MYAFECHVNQGIWLHRVGSGLAQSGLRVGDYSLDIELVLGLVHEVVKCRF